MKRSLYVCPRLLCVALGLVALAGCGAAPSAQSEIESAQSGMTPAAEEVADHSPAESGRNSPRINVDGEVLSSAPTTAACSATRWLTHRTPS